MAGVGGLGLRPLERVDQAGVEAGGRRCRRGRSAGRSTWWRCSRRRARGLGARSGDEPGAQEGGGHGDERDDGDRRRRSRRWRAARSCSAMEDTGRASGTTGVGRIGRRAGRAGGSRGRRAPPNDGGAPGHPADVGRVAASVPCSRGRLVATTPARRPGPARRRRRRRGLVHGVLPVPPAWVVAEAAGDLRGRRGLDGRGRRPAAGCTRRGSSPSSSSPTRSPTARRCRREFHLLPVLIAGYTATSTGRVHPVVASVGVHGGQPRPLVEPPAPAPPAGRSATAPSTGPACSSSSWRR